MSRKKSLKFELGHRFQVTKKAHSPSVLRMTSIAFRGVPGHPFFGLAGSQKKQKQQHTGCFTIASIQ